jgi:hypothetical protein
VDAEHREESEQSNSESAPEGRSHAGTYWLLSAFVFLLFYILSIGPVAKVWVHFHVPAKHPQIGGVVETIYAPIGVLITKYPAARRLFNWYVGDVWHAFPPD